MATTDPNGWSYVDDDEEPTPEDATCNRCGAKGLTWIFTGERNRLFEEHGRPHHCVAKADDFDVVD